MIEFARRAAQMKEGLGPVRTTTWHPWEGIFEYLACVEYARHCLRPKDDAGELLTLYHARALVFFSQATLDLIAVWLQKVLDMHVTAGDRAFHKTRFQNQLIGRSEDFRSLVNEHRAFVQELSAYRTEWIHRVPGRPIFTIGENEAGYKVPIDPSATIFDSANLRVKYEETIKRHGRDSYDISEFANRMAAGTSKLAMGALMASLRHPDIADGPELP